MENVVRKKSNFVFDRIFKLADNEDRHKISEVRVWPSFDNDHEDYPPLRTS